MAMAALSGFQLVLQTQLGKRSEFYYNNLAFRNDDGFSVRQICRPAASSITAPTTESSSKKTTTKRSSKKKSGARGEPVMAFRDQNLVCALASATLERVDVSPTRRVVLDEMLDNESHRRDLSPAGDRSRLESQWTMSVGDSTCKELLSPDKVGAVLEAPSCENFKRGLPSAEKVGAEMEETVSMTSCSKKAVSSGKPKARSRRLEARQRRICTDEKRSPSGAFAIFPRKSGGGRSDNSRKVDGVQGYLSTYLRDITRIDRLTADEELMLAKLVRTGYMMKQERMKLEMAVGHELSKPQWAALLHLKVADLDAKLHEAELARDRMVMANLRLVVSVVKQYNCEGLEMADLIQEGSIGLLKGVERFDFNRGYKLSTYVHWWIRQGVTRAIADHSRTVRLPVHVHDTLGRIRRTKARMLQDGNLATVDNLGEALNLSSDQIRNVMKIPKRLKSLDKQVGLQKNFLSGDAETFHSVVADQRSENQPWTVVEKALLKEDIDKILNTHLGSRERDIIKMHFGVDCQDGYPMSLENISHRYGISRERVRQLERAAKQKLLAAPTGLDNYCCLSA